MVERSIRNKAKKARTRSLLLESAKKLFTERGYEGVKIAEITGTAGVSVGTFYEHFKNKDDIFLEIAREINQNLRARIAAFQERWTQSMSYKDRVRDAVETALDIFDEYPFCVPVIAMGAHSGTPAVSEVYSLIMEDVFKALADYGRIGIKLGDVRDFDPDIAAMALVGIFSGVANVYIRGEFPRESIVDTLTEFVAGGILK